jgi:hypothetical protein
LGQSLTVQGEAPGVQLTVTFTKVVDPACAVGGSSLLDYGMKYVALYLDVVNSGSESYSGSMTNCTSGITSSGQEIGSWVYPTLSEGSVRLLRPVTLQPGDSASGYVVIEIPVNTHLTQINFTPDSGFANDTAGWRIS